MLDGHPFQCSAQDPCYRFVEQDEGGSEKLVRAEVTPSTASVNYQTPEIQRRTRLSIAISKTSPDGTGSQQ